MTKYCSGSGEFPDATQQESQFDIANCFFLSAYSRLKEIETRFQHVYRLTTHTWMSFFKTKKYHRLIKHKNALTCHMDWLVQKEVGPCTWSGMWTTEEKDYIVIFIGVKK